MNNLKHKTAWIIGTVLSILFSTGLGALGIYFIQSFPDNRKPQWFGVCLIAASFAFLVVIIGAILLYLGNLLIKHYFKA